MLLAGPALRQLRADVDVLHLLVSPGGAAAAALLPGIDEVLVADVPWMRDDVEPHDPQRARRAARPAARERATTRSSCSPPTTRARCRWRCSPGGPACRPWSATSDDFPGALLDVRHRRMPDGDDPGFGGGHEVEAMQASWPRPATPAPATTGSRWPTPARPTGLGSNYVVVHPTASVPARGIGAERARDYADALAAEGWRVVVTGGPDDRAVGRAVTPPGGVDLTGRTSLRELAGVLSGAAAVVVGNTGPAHLAAAVGTPVVSLFAPVVPLERWRPWGVPTVVLGDQLAGCAAHPGPPLPGARPPVHRRARAPRSWPRCAPWPGRPWPRSSPSRSQQEVRHEGAHLARARLLPQLLPPGVARLPPAGAARPRPRRPRPRPHVGLARQRPGGDARRSCATRRSTSWCCSAPTRSTSSSGGPAAGSAPTCPSSTSSTTHPPSTPCAASTRCCATRGWRRARRARHRLQRDGLGLRRPPDDGGRARHPRPRRAVHGRGRVAGRQRQRAGAPVAGRRQRHRARHGPLPAGARLRDGQRPARRGGRAAGPARARPQPVPRPVAGRAARRPRAAPRLPPPLPLDQPGPVADRGDAARDAGARPVDHRGARGRPARARAWSPTTWCRLRATARHLLADPDDARARGRVARAHALDRFSLSRFLLDWDRILKEVSP